MVSYFNDAIFATVPADILQATDCEARSVAEEFICMTQKLLIIVDSLHLIWAA